MLYQLSYQSETKLSATVDDVTKTKFGPQHTRNTGKCAGALPLKESAKQTGWMAERSKAPVSGTGLFGGVGSNPTPIIVIFIFDLSVLCASQKKICPVPFKVFL